MKINTLVVKDFVDHKQGIKSHQLPIYATSSFEFEDAQEAVDIFNKTKNGYVYSRYANPTIDHVAAKIAQLEGLGSDKECIAYLTSSGMSAISSVMLGILEKGDHVITQKDLYGGTTELFNKVLTKSGIDFTYIDLNDIFGLKNLLERNKKIKCIYAETPANPTLTCVDILELSTLSKQYGISLIVDNTFCTPIIQQPLKLGADFVIHSTTKYLNGHGNSIAGVIVSPHVDLMKGAVWPTIKLLGSNSNPMDAWLLNLGIKTLALRLEKQCSNAEVLARFLDAHVLVNHVNHLSLPNHNSHPIALKQMKKFGAMLSFEIMGGMESALRWIDNLKLCTHAPTLGDVDTLVLHPASSSHIAIPKIEREAVGISDGLIRISVGIEDIEDLLADITQAFNSINNTLK